MKYYAYENWRVNGHHVTIHVSGCRSCNDGQGRAGGTRPDNGQWLDLGEWQAREEAQERARDLAQPNTLNRGVSFHFCKHCC